MICLQDLPFITPRCQVKQKKIRIFIPRVSAKSVRKQLFLSIWRTKNIEREFFSVTCYYNKLFINNPQCLLKKVLNSYRFQLRSFETCQVMLRKMTQMNCVSQESRTERWMRKNKRPKTTASRAAGETVFGDSFSPSLRAMSLAVLQRSDR